MAWEEEGTSRPNLEHSESNPSNPYEPLDDHSAPEPHRHEFTNRMIENVPVLSHLRKRSNNTRRKSFSNPNSQAYTMGEQSLTSQMHHDSSKSATVPKPGLGPRPVGGDEKLGMFSGVFVPTSLNVLSILMFLRFGFILGQGGVVGIMGECMRHIQLQYYQYIKTSYA